MENISKQNLPREGRHTTTETLGCAAWLIPSSAIRFVAYLYDIDFLRQNGVKINKAYAGNFTLFYLTTGGAIKCIQETEQSLAHGSSTSFEISAEDIKFLLTN